MSVWGDLRKRSSGEIIRREDDWTGFGFDVKVAKSLQNKVPSNGIHDATKAGFKFGGFESLEAMLVKLGVTLEISAETPTRTVPDAISEWALYWENEVKRLKDMGYGKDDPICVEAMNEADKASAEVKNWKDMPIFGRYERFSRKIQLFPNNMKQDMEYYLVTTFVHEAMHAYFNRHHHELFPYVATVEEPLAEFGMLLFLKETVFPKFEWAYNIVKKKTTCYRYGAVLMDSYDKENIQIRQDLEAYKRRLL